MTKVVYKEKLAPSLFRMDLEAPRIAAKAMPGQFIIVRPTSDGERIPLTVAGYDREKGLITIIFQVVGATTYILSQIEQGEEVADFVGPLGQPSHFEGVKRVICIGGGVGTAVVYPQVRHLHEQGVSVDVINGARTKELVILEKELRENSDNLYITTDDGSYVRKGFVTDVLRELLEKGEKYDMAVAIGPIPMMKAVCAVTKEFNLKTMVSLNPIMVDGTGMCGGCRVTVGGKTKYACVDGPDFDGHLVDFDEMASRSRMYKEEEACLSGLFGGGNK
ncbi:MAG: sulfide/dihydroorotate dehydrogenase-like FAD/NAD-binding protein [Clostridia bacterium]|nr:sulfide/dihydroorotate dehydrogenase-like FAD/NAD-binding protein [Clostridia bacterium]